MAVVHIYVTGGIGGSDHISPADATAAILTALLCLLYARYASTLLHIARLLVLDYQYHDIPFEAEEQSCGVRLPRQHIRIDSWTKQESFDFRLFTQVHLHWILAEFGLEQIEVQTNGYIRVFTGFECYCFHLEEIFLFLMTKCRTG